MRCNGGNMVEKIFDIVKENLKNPKFYFAILIAGLILLLLFPYIDANYFYYNRVEKRIAILNDILEIDKDKMDNNPILNAEYESILTEISKQKDGSVGSVFITECSKEVKVIKFMTGAMLTWLVAILCLFVKMDKWWYKLLGLVLFAILGVAIGYVSMIIPIVIDPMCNYIVMPILQLVLLGILVTSGNKK